jgi:hypothetical protein
MKAKTNISRAGLTVCWVFLSLPMQFDSAAQKIVTYRFVDVLGNIDTMGHAEYYNSVAGHVTEIVKGWNGDIMSGGKTFSNKHYQSFINSVPRKNYVEVGFGIRIAVVPLSPVIPSYRTQYRFENTRIVDVDSRGRLIHNLKDPYEVDREGKIYNTKYSFGNE